MHQNEISLCMSLWLTGPISVKDVEPQAGEDGMLLEDSAAAGVCVSGGPVHGHPHLEGLDVCTVSGSLPLSDQTPQRYPSTY